MSENKTVTPTDVFVQDLRGLLDESVALSESTETVVEKDDSLERKAREKRKAKAGGGHNPFKRKTSLGPGPRGGSNRKTNKWKCRCTTPYRCACKAGKRTKIIKIGRAYKKTYNHEFKRWSKNQNR